MQYVTRSNQLLFSRSEASACPSVGPWVILTLSMPYLAGPSNQPTTRVLDTVSKANWLLAYTHYRDIKGFFYNAIPPFQDNMVYFIILLRGELIFPSGFRHRRRIAPPTFIKPTSAERRGKVVASTAVSFADRPAAASSFSSSSLRQSVPVSNPKPAR